MKKRIISVLIISTMILTLVACSKDEPTKTVTNNTVTNTPTVTEEVKPTEETKPTEVIDDNTEVTPTDTVDEEDINSNSGEMPIPLDTEGNPLPIIGYDEDGNPEYMDDLEKEDAPLEINENDKETIKNEMANKEYTSERWMGETRYSLLKYFKEQFPVYSEEKLKEVINEYYPLSEEEEANMFIDFLVNLGTPKDEIRKEMMEYGIDVKYLDAREIDDLVLLANNVKTFLEEHPAMTKKNAYELLIDDGFNDTDARKVLNEIYIPLEEDDLIKAIKKDYNLNDYCYNEGHLEEYLQRYKDELEF